MIKRPSFIKIFSFYLIFLPIIRIFLLSIEKEFPISDVYQKCMELNGLDFFNFWLLFPLSGLALLDVKKQTYYAFIALQAYNLYFHISYEAFAWPYLSQYPSAQAIFLLFINLIITCYLLIPKNRETFFNKRLRWWEQGSRFLINTPCFITCDDGSEIHGDILNLSYSGAFIILNSKLPSISDKFTLEFELMDRSIELKSAVVRVDSEEGSYQYGIKFTFSSFIKKTTMMVMLFILEHTKRFKKYRL